MDYKKVYNEWLNNEFIDEKTKEELKSIKDDEKEIEDRFYTNLKFGTAGLRGKIGAGTNRMNIYVIRKATQGFAKYVMQENKDELLSVAIGYDSRHMSKEFAVETALVFNGNGIKTYLYDELIPVPLVSFAIRQLDCSAGVMITASHNPKEYNGYKPYWKDGGQITSPKDKYIMKNIEDINSISDIKILDVNEAKEKGLYNEIGKEMLERYINVIKKESFNMDLIKEVGKDINIVYTPINGTGNKPVRRVLKEIGFNNVHIVEEQEKPDGDFTTVGTPNPENPEVFELAYKLAKEVDADVIIGTDPDADRIGVVVKNNKGHYEVLNGNMTGVLLAEYIISQKKKMNILNDNSVVIKTIVSTNMINEIADDYGVEVLDVLTGFKYIGEKITEWEKTNEKDYVFGFEESFGSLAGKHARDKDAVIAAMLICELVAVYKQKGLTLYEGLQKLYKKYGYFKEDIEVIKLEGKDGAEKIENIMEAFRKTTLKEINGYKIVKMVDYKRQKSLDVQVGKENDYKELPVSNVLYFEMENNMWFCIRPSGTEPKIKIYFGIKAESEQNAEKCLESIKSEVMEVVKEV